MVADSPILARDAVGPSTPTIQHVLGRWRDEFGQCPDLLAAIGQEGDILVRLQTLALEYVEQPALRLVIVTMRQTDVAGVTIFRHRSADDDLEITLLVFPVANVTTIKADHDAPFWNGQLLPVRRAAVDEAELLLLEFSFGTFGDTQRMLAQGFGVGAGLHR